MMRMIPTKIKRKQSCIQRKYLLCLFVDIYSKEKLWLWYRKITIRFEHDTLLLSFHFITTHNVCLFMPFHATTERVKWGNLRWGWAERQTCKWTTDWMDDLNSTHMLSISAIEWDLIDGKNWFLDHQTRKLLNVDCLSVFCVRLWCTLEQCEQKLWEFSSKNSHGDYGKIPKSREEKNDNNLCLKAYEIIKWN